MALKINNLKVALDARAAGKEITGVGKYVIRLAEGLVKRGVRVVLLCNNKLDQLPKEINCKIIPGKSRFYWEQWAIVKLLNSEDIDIYHATWNYGLPLFFKGKTVLTLHDIIPLMWPYYFWGRNITALPGYLSSLFISTKKANRIIVDSQTTANDVIKKLPYTRDKVEVINIGLDVPVFDKTSRFHDKPYLIYFGGIDKRKNIDGLIRAFFHSKSLNTHDLVIVGKNSDIYQDKIEKLGLKRKVRLVGYVTEEEKYTWFRGATALIYPSFYEGFGIPPLEAMSVGTPVVTSSVSSIPEIVGDSTLLVNPYNMAEITEAIDRITKDERLQQTLRAEGLEQVKKYSWDKMVEETIKVYEEIL